MILEAKIYTYIYGIKCWVIISVTPGEFGWAIWMDFNRNTSIHINIYKYNCTYIYIWVCTPHPSHRQSQTLNFCCRQDERQVLPKYRLCGSQTLQPNRMSKQLLWPHFPWVYTQINDLAEQTNWGCLLWTAYLQHLARQERTWYFRKDEYQWYQCRGRSICNNSLEY